MNWKAGLITIVLTGIFFPVSLFSQELYFERLTGLSETPSTPIHGMVKDSVGYMWFGSWNGVYRYDGKTFDEFRHKTDDPYSLPNNRIRNLILDQNKSLWLLTFDRQMVKYNYSLNRFETIPEENVPPIVQTLLNYTVNQLNKNISLLDKYYYLSGHQLVEEDRITGKKYTYMAEPGKPGGLTDAYVTSFFIDDQGIIWVGTRSGDIYKANTLRKPFHITYVKHEDGQHEQFYSVRAFLKNNDELWFGTNQEGIEIYRNRELLKQKPESLSNKVNQQVRTFYKDSQKNIWIGGVYGLDVFHPQTGQVEAVMNREKYPHLPIPSVYAIQEHQRQLWVGLYNGLAKVSSPNYQVNFIDLTNLIQYHSVMDMLFDADQNLWLATEGNGIIRLSMNDQSEITDTLLLNSSIPDAKQIYWGDMVYSLYQDTHGFIWAGTTDGLFRIKTNPLEIKHFGISEGLPDNYMAAVVGDAQGNIWVSHKKGISKLDAKIFAISNYRLRDKNKDWSFMDGAMFYDQQDSTIYFGARDGFVAFHPGDIKVNPFQPKLVLKSFYISGKQVDPGMQFNGKTILKKSLLQTPALKLSYANRNFAIEMAALHFENPSDNLIQYKMEGYHDEWITTKQNRITFNRVPSGHYFFKAIALSPDHVKSETVSLEIIIQPAWYFSPVALITVFLLLVGLVFLIFQSMLSRERLKNEVELGRLNMEKQEELNRQKTEFFMNVSHDLRTPLTLITDPIKQLQKKGIDDEKRTVYVDLINRNIARLTELINQLLDFRKAEAGKLFVNYKPEDLVELIKEAIQPFELKAQERSINLQFKPDTTDFVGEIDKVKVMQIVTNLVSNALKYTPDHGTVSLTLQTQNSKEECVMIIQDNGVGMDRTTLKKIFEPFNNEGAKPFYGYSSGMGLAITHKLVEILNGSITMESAPQAGTTVRVSFPVNAAEKQSTNSKMPVTSTLSMEVENVSIADTSAEETGKKPLILVVEDSIDVQTYLQTELKDQYEVQVESNGLDGYKTTIKLLPDLIISDVMMPKMDGITLCEQVKHNEQSSHIPVILLTAKTSEESQVEGLKTGADIYLQKPFSIDVLKAQMNSLFENRSRLQAKLANTPLVSDLGKPEEEKDAFILKAIEVVKQNLEGPALNPELLAQALEISRRQLYRKLMATSGSTVQDFINRVRMEKASEYLLETNLNVGEIADRLGFTESSNFSRTFTRHFGQSPTKYRQERKN